MPEVPGMSSKVLLSVHLAFRVHLLVYRGIPCWMSFLRINSATPGCVQLGVFLVL